MFDAQQRLSVQTRLLAQGHALAPQEAPYASDTAPRAMLADALLRARAAQAMDHADPARLRILNEAQAELAALEDARPHWGDYWAVRSFVTGMASGERSRLAIAQLALSYADAPYLNETAGWRTAYAFREWDRLSGDTRDRAIREAVWLARRDYGMLNAVLAEVRDTPAYRPFMLEWLKARGGDADFRPVKGLPPQ